MYLENVELIEINPKIAAIISTDSKTIFDDEDVSSSEVKKGKPKMVPWGANNDLPDLMLEKIRKSDIMSPNMLFNSQMAYGTGLSLKMADKSPVKDPDVKMFFKRNNPVKYLLEQITDIKHFAYAVSVVILTKDGKKIAKIKSKEAFHARFSENNSSTGKIEYVYFANWVDNPKDEEVQAYPVLDDDDPYMDLAVRMGIEPDPETGKNRPATTDRIFAIVTRIATPGMKYYPFPYYAAHFQSGWYDIAEMIPIAKRAKMTQGMMVKYHVEFHRDYFTLLFEDEGITDPKKKLARKKLEFDNIKTFLSGIENTGKVWYSGYYLDPNGKENSMIRINVINKDKEGGDWITDVESAINMGCYAMNVHPSMIGAMPGKTSSMSGTDKRELFTMKQIVERPLRELMLIPYQVVQEFNKWPDDLEFDIPNMVLTTLDEGKDAKEVTTSKDNTDADN